SECAPLRAGGCRRRYRPGRGRARDHPGCPGGRHAARRRRRARAPRRDPEILILQNCLAEPLGVVFVTESAPHLLLVLSVIDHCRPTAPPPPASSRAYLAAAFGKSPRSWSWLA